MSLNASIFACLQADERVTAIFGAGDVMRYFPNHAPQGVAAPFCVGVDVTGFAHETHGTEDDTEDNCDETLKQFSVFAATMTAAAAGRLAIRQALLEDVNDILSSAHIVVTSPATRDEFEESVDLHRADLDLTFFHNPNT